MHPAITTRPARTAIAYLTRLPHHQRLHAPRTGSSPPTCLTLAAAGWPRSCTRFVRFRPLNSTAGMDHQTSCGETARSGLAAGPDGHLCRESGAPSAISHYRRRRLVPDSQPKAGHLQTRIREESSKDFWVSVRLPRTGWEWRRAATGCSRPLGCGSPPAMGLARPLGRRSAPPPRPTASER